MSEISFTASPRDFRRLQAFMGQKLARPYRRIYVVAVFASVLLIAGLALAIVLMPVPQSANDATWMILTYVPFGIVPLLFIIPITRYFIRTRLARVQVSDDNPLLGPTKLAVEPDGLVFDRALVKSKYSWPAFRWVEVSDKFVVLAIDNGMGLIIPPEAFAGDAERYAFVADVCKRIEESKAAPAKSAQ